MNLNSIASLKLSNLAALSALVALDATVFLMFVAPDHTFEISLKQITTGQSIIGMLLLITVLTLPSMMSSEQKASLVFWKLKNPLPGSEAFTRCGPRDARIDMAQLEKNVGPLPSDPAEQNQKWFKLYHLVSEEKAVKGAHREFLLFRDMSAMSFILFFGASAACWILVESTKATYSMAYILFAQYSIFALCARNRGRRLVSNVLAVHSVKKIRSAK
jgi:hypothetical protein